MIYKLQLGSQHIPVIMELRLQLLERMNRLKSIMTFIDVNHMTERVRCSLGIYYRLARRRCIWPIHVNAVVIRGGHEKPQLSQECRRKLCWNTEKMVAAVELWQYQNMLLGYVTLYVDIE